MLPGIASNPSSSAAAAAAVEKSISSGNASKRFSFPSPAPLGASIAGAAASLKNIYQRFVEWLKSGCEALFLRFNSILGWNTRPALEPCDKTASPAAFEPKDVSLSKSQNTFTRRLINFSKEELERLPLQRLLEIPDQDVPMLTARVLNVVSSGYTGDLPGEIGSGEELEAGQLYGIDFNRVIPARIINKLDFKEINQLDGIVVYRAVLRGVSKEKIEPHVFKHLSEDAIMYIVECDKGFHDFRDYLSPESERAYDKRVTKLLFRASHIDLLSRDSSFFEEDGADDYLK